MIGHAGMTIGVYWGYKHMAGPMGGPPYSETTDDPWPIWAGLPGVMLASTFIALR